MTQTPVVKAQSEMDAETFLKHINARHEGILPGVPIVGRSNIPGDEDESMLRAFHDYTHEHAECNHTHREAQK